MIEPDLTLFHSDHLAALFAASPDLPPARLAVIGCPVAHSLSPHMHQPALHQAGIHARYVKVEVPPGKVASTLRSLGNHGFIGCNVTVPHKKEALDACDQVSTQALEMGAVNTIHFSAGKLIGHNTDGFGFEQAIRESFALELSHTPLLIAGAGGGAGTAIATHAALLGCPLLLLANRSIDKIETLRSHLHHHHPHTEVLTFRLDDPKLATAATKVTLIANTSSLGLKADDPSPIPSPVFQCHHRVYDTIYREDNAFQLAARAAGCQVATGRSMLLHQGAQAFRIWFPHAPDPVAAMRQGLASAAS